MEVVLGKMVDNCQNVEKDVVKLKQEDAIKIARQVEVVVVIGDKKNEANLYNVVKQEIGNSILVEKIEELYINYIKRFKKVGIISEISASQDLFNEVVDIIKNLETEGYMYENSR